MKKPNVTKLVAFLFLFPLLVTAQVSIGTNTPDSSAVLDLTSTTQGLLLPRMTTVQQALIVNPAIGLTIYNITNNDLETNTGTSLFPNWKGTKGGFETVTESINTSTTSLIDDRVSGMVLNPASGIYSVTFNSQYNNAQLIANTPQIISDLETLYNTLKAMPMTDNTHELGFGNPTVEGEIVLPGVYDIVGGVTITTNLRLDAGGNPDALFIIRVVGALSTASIAKVILANEAKAKNVFWVIDGAISFGAGAIMKGIVISHGYAIAGASGVNLEGRMFTTSGAITFGPATAAIPLGNSLINLGSLAPYVIFTQNGNIVNTAISSYSGDIGTIQGNINGFDSATVNGIIHNATSFDSAGTLVDNTNKMAATFSIYQNGVLIPSSRKILTSTPDTSNISLQAIATVTSGEPIEVKWKTSLDKLEMGNRTLTIIKVQ
jgi:hypothetical protein